MITELLKLASQLPSGLNDARAVEKLAREMSELHEALAADDATGALLEAADVAYYACKAIQYAARLCNVSVEDVMRAAQAKYSLRARPGNPKDDAAERAAASANQVRAGNPNCQEEMMKGKGWFAYFFSALCAGEDIEDVEAGVYVNPADGKRVYNREDFRKDFAAAVSQGWGRGSTHPNLGQVKMTYDLRSNSVVLHLQRGEQRASLEIAN